MPNDLPEYQPFNVHIISESSVMTTTSSLPAQCKHLGSKRRCCDSLFLCRKYPGESCCPTDQQTAPGVLRCDACEDFEAEDNSSERSGVCFLSAAYMEIGGTETFHRSLLPQLRDMVDINGFVATAFHGGDGLLLQVPYATGIEAAKEVAARSAVVVAWGISDLKSILPINRPKVIAVHHSDWSSDWGNGLILNQLDLIDEVIGVNADTVAKLSERTGKPVHCIPNAIDTKRITPSGQQSELRTRHCIPADLKVVLFGHRLSVEKRPALAVKIAQHLPDDWVMVIAGNGPERTAIESVQCDRVRIVGACDSLADWLSIADCFLSLSSFEGFGLAIGEAMAAGVPTVSTPAGIAPGLATTLPVNATAKEWADAIVTAKIKAQPADILDRFSVQRMVDSWADILKTIPQAKE